MDDVVTIRLAPELWFFVAAPRRRAEFQVRYDGTASLGHVVQACNVPLTEVGALRVDGQPGRADQRLHPNAVVEVEPVARPQRVPGWRGGFALDVHLGTLARRLRLLGIDATYRNDADDDELVQLANAEGRILLTQDRGLLKRRALRAGAFVRGARPADQLADVLDRFAPPLRPWSRCPCCNGLIETVAKDDVTHLLQPGTRRTYHRFARCRECGKVYWQGAHGQRLQAIVERASTLSGGDVGSTA